MNTLKIILSSYPMLFSLLLSAQEKALPQRIPYQAKTEVSSVALEKLFHSSGSFTVTLAPTFILTGSIQNRVEKAPGVISLLIKTENGQGEMLSLSRSIGQDGTILYTGHLLKLHEPEGTLLIEKDKHYYFIRTEQRWLVAE